MLLQNKGSLLALIAAAALLSAQSPASADADVTKQLYGPMGEVYVYDQAQGVFLCNGAQAPDGMPLYQLEYREGEIYFTSQPYERIEAQRMNLWTNISVILGSASVIELFPTASEPAVPVVHAAKVYALQTDISVDDAAESARRSLVSLQAAVKVKGIETLFNALAQYCSDKRYPYSTSMAAGKCSFTYTVKNMPQDIYADGVIYTFSFDMKSRVCSVTLRAPHAGVARTAFGPFVLPAPATLADYGLTLTDTPYLTNGYTSYIVKDVRQFSSASLAGFEKFDQIVAIDSNAITAAQPRQQLLKQIAKQVYQYQYPVTVTCIRKGIMHRLELNP